MVELVLVKTRGFLGTMYHRSERTKITISILPSDQSQESSHLHSTEAFSRYSYDKLQKGKKKKKMHVRLYRITEQLRLE